MEYSKKRILFFKWLTPVLTMLLSLVLLEVSFFVLGKESIYENAIHYSTTPASWWTCDSLNGPRFVPNAASGKENFSVYFQDNNLQWYYDRLQLVNAQGYHDTEDFSAEVMDTTAFRVLFLGDSFTWGASADMGYSYVETFEKEIKATPSNVQVWNTAIPATGTKHALFTARKFLPVMRPDLVILGLFVGNDLDDNMLPFDQLQFLENGSCFTRYKLNKQFEAEPQTIREAFKMATGTYPLEELTQLQVWLIKSRLFSFLKKNLQNAYNRIFAPNWKEAYDRLKVERTTELLRELKVLIEKQGAHFLIVLIPSQRDLEKKTADYEKSVRMIGDLSIPCLYTRPFLEEADYVNKPHDDHWNNSGHQKIGKMLARYSRQLDFN